MNIWFGRYDSGEAWQADAQLRDAMNAVRDSIDDNLLPPRRVTTRDAWCAACSTVRPMRFHWHFGELEPDGSVHPAWTETGGCEVCGLNSRMRALVAFVRDRSLGGRCFVAERITPSYPVIVDLFDDVVGAEYLGDDVASGDERVVDGTPVRHEDLTRLSFADGSVDVVITQDVFEHIPDTSAALRECARVLAPRGRLVFTIPFFPEQASTRPPATPEVHGNPLGGGSVCHHHFGWDLLDRLRDSGFTTATAHTYWGPWQGHVGPPAFVFEAVRG